MNETHLEPELEHLQEQLGKELDTPAYLEVLRKEALGYPGRYSHGT